MFFAERYPGTSSGSRNRLGDPLPEVMAYGCSDTFRVEADIRELLVARCVFEVGIGKAKAFDPDIFKRSGFLEVLQNARPEAPGKRQSP